MVDGSKDEFGDYFSMTTAPMYRFLSVGIFVYVSNVIIVIIIWIKG